MAHEFHRAKPVEGPRVVLVRNAQQLTAAFRRIKGATSRPTWSDTHGAAGVTWPVSTALDPVFVVYIADDADAPYTVGIIAHEALHVCEGYLRYIGEEHPGEETRAYLVGAVTQSLMTQMVESLAKERAKK